MSKPKTILFDLDGTLTQTARPDFTVYRDGKSPISVDRVPVIPGARELILKTKEAGHHPFIVSDSHPRFVDPIAREIFGVPSFSLAYKPATDKISIFLRQHSPFQLPSSRIFVVGDSHLDIHLARRLGVPSVFIQHESEFHSAIWATIQKEGPTFSCVGFSELFEIIENPLAKMLVIEGQAYGNVSLGDVKVFGRFFESFEGRKRFQIALARQEIGPCDIFARSDWYRRFSHPNRTEVFLSNIASGVSRYILYFQNRVGVDFNMVSFVPDKSSTVPAQKMENFTNLIQSGIFIERVLEWDSKVVGSIRKKSDKKQRYDFVRKFMRHNSMVNVQGKNIIILDDQLTTGATMEAVSHILWEAGAKHILFIALFYMVSEISRGELCPRCKKELSIRTRRADGNQFYSCVSPKYGGIGCGFTKNL